MLLPLLLSLSALGGNHAQHVLQSALDPYRRASSVELVYGLEERSAAAGRRAKSLTSLRFKVVVVRGVGWIAQDAGSMTAFPHWVYMVGPRGYAVYADGRKLNLEQVTLAANTGVLCHPMALVQGGPAPASARFGAIRSWAGEAVFEVQAARGGYSYFVSRT
jgi:hypothetical protein